MISGSFQTFNGAPKSVISSNLSFFKGRFEDLKQFYQEKDQNCNLVSRKRIRSTIENVDKSIRLVDMSEASKFQRKITVSKATGPKLTFKTIDVALCFLQGDVSITEFLLVISPGKQNLFEIHGIDKNSRQYLGTIYVIKEDLKQFEDNQTFEKYSMIVSNTALDPKASLEFLLSQLDILNESDCSTKQSSVSVKIKTLSSYAIGNNNSDPTLHDLLRRLDRSSKTKSDITQFFDFAEKYNFLVVIRPDFINFSNQLILEFFTPQENYVGSLTLTNQEIESQLKQHRFLLANTHITEDTNEIVVSKGVARFLRGLASALNLLYIYDYVSEFIYKIYQNM